MITEKKDSTKSCLTLVIPWACQAPLSIGLRILEWVAISFSRGTSQHRNWTQVSRIAGRCFTNWAIREAYLKYKKMKVKVKLLSHVWLFATPWTVAHQASPSLGFSRQDYWSGLPFPSPGELPDPAIEPRSPALQADALTSEPPGKLMTTTWLSCISFSC